MNVLAAANTLQSVGRVEDHDLLYLLMAANELHSVDDVKQTVVRAGPARRGASGRCRRRADLGVVPQFLGVDADGKRAVTLLLFQQPGTDMVAIARQASANAGRLRAANPAGRHLEQMVRPERAGAGRGQLRA